MHRAARMLSIFTATSQFTLAMAGYFVVTWLGSFIAELGGKIEIDRSVFIYVASGALVLLLGGMGGGPAPAMGTVVAIVLTVLAGVNGPSVGAVFPWVVLQVICLVIWVGLAIKE